MKYLLLVLTSLSLSGCGSGTDTGTGSGSGQGQNVPFRAEYHGSWGVKDLAVAMVSSSSITTYVYDESRSCYEADFFNVTASTEKSLTAKDVATGEVATSTFELINGGIRIREGNETLDLPPVENFLPSPGCPSVHGFQTITAEINLEFLPPYITINRSAQSSGYVEYSYEINFDMNKNSRQDAGDVSLMLRHFKGSGVADQQLPLGEVRASIWNYVQENGTTRLLANSSSETSSTLELEQQGSTLRFIASVPQYASFMHIAADIPVSVRAYMNYPSPETQTIDGFSDGPWKWSSAEHQDIFPEQGMAIPNTYPQQLMTDATGDLTKGQSKWVDIKSVKLSFN